MNKTQLRLIVFAAIAFATPLMAQRIMVTVDGDPVQFTDTGPRMIGGRVLVPLRGVFEQMGATVDWNDASQTVIAHNASTDLKLHIGDRRAIVNGNEMMLDVPAMMVGGRTMVPLRFVSEALGAEVRWFAAKRLVAITSDTRAFSGTGSSSGRSEMRARRTLPSNTVIPVSLDERLTSSDSKARDTFSTTIKTADGGDYGPLPSGTKVEGHVVTARPRKGSDPGILSLDFDRVKLPDGRVITIDGSLIGLNDKKLERRSNGTLVAKGGSGKDERLVYAGYGAGAGLLISVITGGRHSLETTILGGVLGYIAGTVKNQQDQAKDVTLEPGTEFGVLLRRDLNFTAARGNR